MSETANTQKHADATASGPLLRLGVHIGAVVLSLVLFTVLVLDLVGSSGTSGLAWTMAGLLVAVAAGQGAFMVLSRNIASADAWADDDTPDATDDVPADDEWGPGTPPAQEDDGAWDAEAAWGAPAAEEAPEADTAWPEHEKAEADETAWSEKTMEADTAWPQHEKAEADETAWSEKTMEAGQTPWPDHETAPEAVAEADDDVYTVGCPSCGTAFTITAEVAAQGELHCVHCGVTGEIVDEDLQKDRIEDVTCDDCSHVYAAHGATSTCPECGAEREAPVTA